MKALLLLCLLSLSLGTLGVRVGLGEVKLPGAIAPGPRDPFSLLPDAPVSADELLQQGRRLQQEAVRLTEHRTKVGRLTAAIVKYQRAAQAEPGRYDAHFLWATALAQLVPLTPRPEDRQKLILQTDQRFQATSECEGVDGLLFIHWFDFVGAHMLTSGQEDKILIKMESIARRGAAISSRKNRTHHAALLAGLGRVLVFQASLIESKDREQAIALYREAVETLDRARENDTVRRRSDITDKLAIACLDLGIWTKDNALVERARDLYQDLLNLDTKNETARYNLACVYSRLGRFQEAVEQLRALDITQPGNRFMEVIGQDPDMDEFRDTETFQQLLREQHALLVDQNLEELLARATALQHQASNEPNANLKIAKLVEVVDLFEESVRLKPNEFRAHWGLGRCLVQVLALSEKGHAHELKIANEARQHLEQAVAFNQSDAGVYQTVAAFLMGPYRALLSDVETVNRLMERIMTLCQLGLEKKNESYTLDVAKLHLLYAEAATRRAMGKGQPAMRQTLYLQAIKSFERGNALMPVKKDSRLVSIWGGAFLQLSILSSQKIYAREAIALFKESLEHNPDEAGLYYSLSCSYALLGDAKNWLKYHTISLDKDTSGIYARAALKEVYLDRIRHTPEYENLMDEQSNHFEFHQPVLSR